MYKYFKDLEKRNNFKIFLKRPISDIKKVHIVNYLNLNDEELKKLSDISPYLDILDKLIMGMDESLYCKTREYIDLPYSDKLNVGEFFSQKENSYAEIKDITNKLNISALDIKNLLKEYSYSIPYLIMFFPNQKEFLLKVKTKLDELLSIFKNKTSILLPDNNEGIELNWPNAWYITPNNRIYNTGIGHKEGNLEYPYFYHICPSFRSNKPISIKNNYEEIQNIIERQYITDNEFRHYSNMTLRLPSIDTPETDIDKERKDIILKLNDKEFKSIEKIPEKLWPHPIRSYQPNLITLIIGYLDAEQSLYRSLAVLNNSSNMQYMIGKLNEYCMYDLGDVLVRFCGFNKVESLLDNTITTCSINGIKEFEEYLNRGWNLHILPGITYDRTSDTLTEVDLDSYFVSKYLERNLKEYNGKGKILIKDKWI